MLSDEVKSEFEKHSERLREHARAKRQSVLLRSIVTDTEEREALSADDLLGRRQPHDEFQGDVNLRTLRALLAKIDEKGFERVRRLRPMGPPTPPLLTLIRTYAVRRAPTNSSSTLPLSARRLASSTRTTGERSGQPS